MQGTLNRQEYLFQIRELLGVHRCVALLGPRQCGKTTLAKQFVKNQDSDFLDLENPTHLSRLENPLTFLRELDAEIVVVDEIQRRPELFPVLRVLIDELPKKSKRRFVILGSASRDLIRQSSETLAGRIGYIELSPFSAHEFKPEAKNFEKLWLRGGFPRSFLAKNEAESMQWRNDYIQTYLERDIPQLGFNVPALQLRRFWMMLSHFHAQIFNSSEIGSSMGIAHTTARRYLDLLTGTFMIRELSPWHENIQKRQVKAPKIYFRDSGLLHALMAIQTKKDLLFHAKLGASWEGFALETVIRSKKVRPEECHFWGVHGGGELDLLLPYGRKREGYEFKYSEVPKVTASMRSAFEHLKLDSLTVVVPGTERYKLEPKVEVVGLNEFVKIQRVHTEKKSKA